MRDHRSRVRAGDASPRVRRMRDRRLFWLGGLLLAAGLALIVLRLALGSIDEFDHGATVSPRAIASLGPAPTSIRHASVTRS